MNCTQPNIDLTAYMNGRPTRQRWMCISMSYDIALYCVYCDAIVGCCVSAPLAALKMQLFDNAHVVRLVL